MANRIIQAFSQFFDDAGDPLTSGKLVFLEPGTTSTNKATYSDSDLTIPNPNPVILDGAGRCPNVFGDGDYKVLSYTSDDILVQTFDPVGIDTGTGLLDEWSSSVSYSVADMVRYQNLYYRSLTSSNANNNPISSPANWELLRFGRAWTSNTTYNLNDSVYGSDGILYVSKIAANFNNDPIGDTVNWTNNKTQDDIRIETGLGISYACSGAANTYAIDLPTGRAALTSLYVGLNVQFFGSADNTGSSTLDVSALLSQTAGSVVKDIKLTDGTNLGAGDIRANQLAITVYNGSHFVLATPLSEILPATKIWTNESGSRSSGVTYTNSSGADIMVAFNIQSTGTSSVSATVGGVVIYNHSIGGVQSLSFMVGKGETYAISYNNVSSHTWAEWKR